MAADPSALLRRILHECDREAVRIYLNAHRHRRGRPPNNSDPAITDAARLRLDRLLEDFSASALLDCLAQLPGKKRGRPRRIKTLGCHARNIDELANIYNKNGSTTPVEDAFCEWLGLMRGEGSGMSAETRVRK